MGRSGVAQWGMVRKGGAQGWCSGTRQLHFILPCSQGDRDGQMHPPHPASHDQVRVRVHVARHSPQHPLLDLRLHRRQVWNDGWAQSVSEASGGRMGTEHGQRA